MFTMVATGGASLALADPPAAPPAESRGPMAQSSTAADGTPQHSAAQTAPATGTQVNASPRPASTSPDEPPDDKMLRLRGYRPTMMNGEMVYCRREIPLGSHLPTMLHCVTAAEAKLMTEEGRRTTERMQMLQNCGVPGGGASCTR